VQLNIVTRLSGKVFTGLFPSNGLHIVTRLSGKVFTGLFPSNRLHIVARMCVYRPVCLAMGIHVTISKKLHEDGTKWEQ
jgi:hypothetical protein